MPLFTGRTEAEAAISACGALGLTRKQLTTDGEGRTRVAIETSASKASPAKAAYQQDYGVALPRRLDKFFKAEFKKYQGKIVQSPDYAVFEIEFRESPDLYDLLSSFDGNDRYQPASWRQAFPTHAPIASLSWRDSEEGHEASSHEGGEFFTVDTAKKTECPVYLHSPIEGVHEVSKTLNAFLASLK